ncbi:MAG TPA: SCO family protein [Saprospiraceae bacterium]|nr:SCO family protein [Saprospiraceae bacterium]
MKYLAHVFILLIAAGCQSKKLPIIGIEMEENGIKTHARTPDFSLYNQDSIVITQDSIKDKIHIANFFFTSCPTICPKTMRSMVELEKKFGSNPTLLYLCFSIDYKRDSVQQLKSYARKLGIQNPRFHLLSMPSNAQIKAIAERYMSVAMEDESAAGGFDHSGWILLVDGDQHIRSYALGTDPKEMEKFAKDIELLQKEYQENHDKK